MVVADIGRHVGIEMLTMSRWIGPQGRVFSFEPDAETVKRLRRNCQSNDLQNVTIIVEAISDHSVRIRFDSLVTSHGVAGDGGGNEVICA
jgi:FkbM family methyltransferase